MKESQLVSLIIKRLWYERHWLKVWRANAGKVKVTDQKGNHHFYQGNINGCPDIIGYCAPFGRFIGIECKIGKNTQTEYQKVFEEDSTGKGAIYIIAKSLEDVEQVLNKLKPQGSLQ